MGLKVYLDDVRNTPQGFDTRVYTAWEAIDLLNSGNVDLISLDHDLGANEKKVGNGYNVACHIEKMAYEGKKIPQVLLHSANPVGVKAMRLAIMSAIKISRETSQHNDQIN